MLENELIVTEQVAPLSTLICPYTYIHQFLFGGESISHSGSFGSVGSNSALPFVLCFGYAAMLKSCATLLLLTETQFFLSFHGLESIH